MASKNIEISTKCESAFDSKDVLNYNKEFFQKEFIVEDNIHASQAEKKYSEAVQDIITNIKQ